MTVGKFWFRRTHWEQGCHSPVMALLRRVWYQPRMLVLFLAADIWSAGKISFFGEDNKRSLCSVHACVAMIYRQQMQV